MLETKVVKNLRWNNFYFEHFLEKSIADRFLGKKLILAAFDRQLWLRRISEGTEI